MKRILVSCGFLFVCLWLAAPAFPQDSAELQRVEEHMKLTYAELLTHLEDPAEREDMIYIDPQKGYSYSAEKGLYKLQPRPEQVGPKRLEAGVAALDEGGYNPWRRVMSKPCRRKAEGYITLPSADDFEGVDVYPGEAAYNYLGLMRVDEMDFEAGLCSWGKDEKQWYVFYHYYGQQQRRDVDNGEEWPAGGIAPGTKVFLRMYVPEDDKVALHIQYGQTTKTFTFPAEGAKKEGGNKLRRLTSLIVQTESGKLLNNKWETVCIATAEEMHLWEPDDTLFGPKDTWIHLEQYVDTTDVDEYYNETIHIELP